MLYKLNFQENDYDKIEPVPFFDFRQLSKIEKDLENLLAQNLLDKLFEDNALMAIYQERSFESKGDIYALAENGDLVVFELKRSMAGDDAMVQILRYAQTAGQWTYDRLNRYFQKDNPEKSLDLAHQEAFQLERPLTPAEFNRNQHLYVVGSATNETLAKSLTYWKSKGISVEFIPYRVYEIENELYFEFFSKPNDLHINPNQIKGVILDTNRSFNEDAIWDMLIKERASAYGSQSYIIAYLNKRDIVFLSHKGYGLIAAGEVISTKAKKEYNDDLDEDEGYVEVKWLTIPPQKRVGLKGWMPFSKVTEILEHGFYWARTLKTPYLSKEESDLLLAELKNILGKK